MIQNKQLTTCSYVAQRLDEIYNELRALEQRLYLAGLHDEGLRLSGVTNSICSEGIKLDSMARKAFVAARNSENT